MAEIHPVLLRFGRGVVTAREARALTRRDLAERTGLSVAQITAIEQGIGDPTITEMQAIANALELDVWTLFVEFTERCPEPTPRS